jgi:hypothetical protein
MIMSIRSRSGSRCCFFVAIFFLWLLQRIVLLFAVSCCYFLLPPVIIHSTTTFASILTRLDFNSTLCCAFAVLYACIQSHCLLLLFFLQFFFLNEMKCFHASLQHINWKDGWIIIQKSK